jgi:hypothetical protein
MFDDVPYTVMRNGKVLSVPSVDDICEIIHEKFSRQEAMLNRLSEENKNLHDEKYADVELQNMKHDLDLMREDYYRGFPISKDEMLTIEDWQKKHDETDHGVKSLADAMKLEGVSGGRFTYLFVPTSLGVIGKIRCSCGKEFCFRNL